MVPRAGTRLVVRLGRKARASWGVSVVTTSQMEDVSLDPQFAELFTVLRTHEWALHVDRLSLSGEPATSPVCSLLCSAAPGGGAGQPRLPGQVARGGGVLSSLGAVRIALLAFTEGFYVCVNK